MEGDPLWSRALLIDPRQWVPKPLAHGGAAFFGRRAGELFSGACYTDASALYGEWQCTRRVGMCAASIDPRGDIASGVSSPSVVLLCDVTGGEIEAGAMALVQCCPPI